MVIALFIIKWEQKDEPILCYERIKYKLFSLDMVCCSPRLGYAKEEVAMNTPYGEGKVCDRFENGMISVRLPINELTLSIPPDRLVTKSEKFGVWLFLESELK